MPVDLIIDGYNLMHFAGLARTTYGPGGLQRARHRLLVRLTNRLTVDEVRRTVVVFDAAGVPDWQQREERFRKLRVVYSPQGLEADDVIEELVAHHAAPRQLTVVSSDNRLIRAIRRRKGISRTSDEFLDDLDQLRGDEAELETADEVDAPLADEEIESWMREFGLSGEVVDLQFPEKPAELSPPQAPRTPQSPAATPKCSPESPRGESVPSVPEVEPNGFNHTSRLLAELEEVLRRCLEED